MSKKQKTPKGTKVTKEFLFKLTDAEVNEKGKVAAKARAGAAKLELQFEEVKDGWKAKIKVQENLRDAALDVIHAGEEKRTVDCVMVKNFNEKKVEYWFEDKVLDTRPMTADELQVDMPLDSKRGQKARAVAQKLQKGDGKPPKADPVAEAHAAANGNGKFSDIADVHQMETHRASKTSAVDGPTRN